MVDFSKLNPAQKKAVEHTDGPVMILAGAGSGKTRTLVARISYILEDLRVSPFRILALTFSNKAAREMRERVASEVAEDIGALQITTFHAFCARVLRSEAKYIGLSQNFTIYDTSESKAVVKTLLQRRGISTKETSPFEILYFMDELKNNGYYKGRQSEYFEPDKDDFFYEIYKEYEAELHRANAVDFGGLITGVIQLFEKFPEVLERYQQRFQYLLVDEYQDTNRAQFDLLKMLSENHHNICVVGDEDQSIYSWRGADINNILDFEKLFPQAETLKLEQNYRSSKNIIEAASHVIARNSMRKGKNMWTRNDEGEVIDIVEIHNDKKEAEFVAETINELHKNKNIEHREMAVFYRTNSQSRLIEDYLRKARIPYRVVGGVKFYERKEIKDLIAYMRLVVNPKDSLALSRIINVPTRGIGATTLRKLENEAINQDLSLLETMENISDNYESYTHLRLSAKVKSAMRQLVDLFNEIRLLEKDEVPPSVQYEKLLHESGYFDFLKASKDYESLARIENLEELGNAITQFEEVTEKANLLGFLETITLDTSSGQEDSNDGEVSLMTVHGAKGLEFSHVFLTGAEENIFPSYKSLEMGAQAEEEERRLFYVAMTRAMKRLYITFAQGRMLFGQLKFNGPSRFLHEIPNKYYNWKKLHGGAGSSSSFNWNSEDEWSPENDNQDVSYDEGEVVYQVQSETVSKPVLDSKFPKGSRVVHSLYGEGTVTETEGIGADEKVTIIFSDGARKKFMVKFAPLVNA